MCNADDKYKRTVINLIIDALQVYKARSETTGCLYNQYKPMNNR